MLGIGYVLGKLKLGSFTLGAVTGTLLAGVVVGQLGVQVSDEVKQCFFLLFLFSIGFRTGPQFFRGLKSDGLQQAALAAIVATTGLVVAYVVSRLLGYDAGTAAGVIAGALTESATIGTASDAIARLGLPEAERLAMTNRIPVAFAVTYLIGVVGAAWFLAQLAPRLMGVDLEEECRRYEAGAAGRTTSRVRVAAGHRVSSLRGAARIAAGRAPRPRARAARRATRACSSNESGAAIRCSSRTRRRSCRRATRWRSPAAASCWSRRIDEQALGVREVDDKALLDIPAEALDVVVTRADIDGRTLADLAGDEAVRSVYLRRITRAGTPVADSPRHADPSRRRGHARRARRAGSRRP